MADQELKTNWIVILWGFFKGKKTYLIGSLMVILGFLDNNMEMILEGLGMITLRNGIKR